MLANDGRTGRHDAGSWMRALAAAALLLGSLALPVSAASGPNRLFDPVVTPRTGTTSTTISRHCLVSQRGRLPKPSGSAFQFEGSTYDMTQIPGGSWKDGVKFTWSGTLPNGNTARSSSAPRRRDHFAVRAGRRHGHDRRGADADANAAADSDTAAHPANPGQPTPTPTPRPTPTPTATPSADAHTHAGGNANADL